MTTGPTALNAAETLATEVGYYLTQTPRQLPSRALYDTLGSALFDAICHLPWYPVTRAERRLIRECRTEILDAAGRPARVIELGPGNGDKLDLLLGPLDHPHGITHVDLVDVSPSALSAATRLISEGRQLTVAPHAYRYEDGLARAVSSRADDRPVAVIFLGSNIGNFDPPGATSFLETIRSSLRADDALVIGADLVKPERELILAYDDPLGVTAAFNKNLLVHLNRELGATFDISRFAHRALWNSAQSRVEMHLISDGRQSVEIPKAGVAFDLRAGESIWTESSYKYEIRNFEAMLRRAGFTPAQHWIDREGQFLLVAARAA